MLVAVDGSGAAQRALRAAVALAKLAPESSIHLVHAHEEPRVYGEIAVYITPEKMRSLQRTQCEALLAGAEAELKGSGVRHTRETLEGPLAQKVLHATRLPVLLVRWPRGRGAPAPRSAPPP